MSMQGDQARSHHTEAAGSRLPGWYRRARVGQIRLTTALLRRALVLPGASAVLDGVRAAPVLRSAYAAGVGYHRPFGTLAEAERAIAPFANEGHENAANSDNHLDYYQETVASDLAAMFFLRDMLPSCRRLFDLGGNVGHLYYYYAPYLTYRDDLVWQVLDLPRNMERGRALALERRAPHLFFAEGWPDASGADVLLCSGAMHYFPRPLSGMVAELAEPPRHVLVNRVPLTDGEPFAAVQERPGFRVACMVHNRQALVEGFAALGYGLRGAWRVPDLSLVARGHPRFCVPAYSGLCFSLDGDASGSH